MVMADAPSTISDADRDFPDTAVSGAVLLFTRLDSRNVE